MGIRRKPLLPGHEPNEQQVVVPTFNPVPAAPRAPSLQTLEAAFGRAEQTGEWSERRPKGAVLRTLAMEADLTAHQLAGEPASVYFSKRAGRTHTYLGPIELETP